MKISLASDHGGFLLKEEIKKHLLTKGYEVVDFGTDSLSSCDYPLFSKKAAEAVSQKDCEYGIVVCTSGEGVCMTSNKVKGIRCGLVYNEEVAKLIRLHNNANMMALGAKFINKEEALHYVDIFLTTDFEGGRHLRRVEMIES